jgi:hypothetical protein
MFHGVGRHAGRSGSWQWLDHPVVAAVLVASAVITGAEAFVNLVPDGASDGQTTVIVSVHPSWPFDAYLDAIQRAGEALRQFASTAKGEG